MKSSTRSTLVRHHLRWKAMAEKLCRVVQEVDGYRYHRHLPKWEDQFRLLHEQDGADLSTIWEVLKWYCSMKRLKKLRDLPNCVTGNVFRGAFPWIREKWEKSGAGTDLDEEWVGAAERTFGELEFDRTPLTIESLAGLYQKIARWYDSTVNHLRQIRNLDKGTMVVLSAILTCSSDGMSFPEQVGHYLHNEIVGWRGWRGDISSFAPLGERFIEFLQARSLDRNGMRLSNRYLGLLSMEGDEKKAN